MKTLNGRFQFLRWRLSPLKSIVGEDALHRRDLRRDLLGRRFPVRLLRYWWVGQALAAESRRRGRKLRVLDLGCERGWLRLFTPAGSVAEWVGADWSPRPTEEIGYDRAVSANFDQLLPFESGAFDAVVSLHVFEHLPRPGSTISEVSRLLKKDGVFLAATPTMPEPFAKWRERYYRRAFHSGRVTPGGHINSMSPRRWHRLLYEVGLSVEFLTGSHAVRWSGNMLEDRRWWIRLNQIWGAMFPALGSECCLQARREHNSHEQAVPLSRRQRMPRLALASAAVLLFAALAFGLARTTGFLPLDHADVDKQLAGWIHRNQGGNDRFYVWHGWAGETLRSRADVILIDHPSDLPTHPPDWGNTRILLSQETSREFLRHDAARMITIGSHIEVGQRDFYLLHYGLNNRTTLDEFL